MEKRLVLLVASCLVCGLPATAQARRDTASRLSTAKELITQRLQRAGGMAKYADVVVAPLGRKIVVNLNPSEYARNEAGAQELWAAVKGRMRAPNPVKTTNFFLNGGGLGVDYTLHSLVGNLPRLGNSHNVPVEIVWSTKKVW